MSPGARHQGTFTLPADVVDALRLRTEWLKTRFPSHESFSASP